MHQYTYSILDKMSCKRELALKGKGNTLQIHPIDEPEREFVRRLA